MNLFSPISLQSLTSSLMTRWPVRWPLTRQVKIQLSRCPGTKRQLWQQCLTGMVCTSVTWAMMPAIAWAISSPVEPEMSGKGESEPLNAIELLFPHTLSLDFSDSGTSDNTVGGASRAFPDFRGTGRPGNQSSAGSRGLCSPLENSPSLTLLVPEEAQDGGYTHEANPTLWAYVPYLLDANSPIEFSLQDIDGNVVYETFQAIDHEPGILKLDLPSTVTLEIGQVYEWYLMLYCDDPEGFYGPSSWASGWIERIDAPVTNNLEALSLVEQSNVYANQLIWYDALNILAEGLLDTPNDPQLLDAWTHLLSLPSVKLDAISPYPISECCELPDR